MWHGMHGGGCGSRGGWARWAARAEERFEDMGARGWRGRGGGWGGGGSGSGGGRARRVFDGAELRLLLLKLIADEPRHGYELIRAVEAATAGAYAPSPGVVYPSLSMLDEMGLVAEQRTDDARRRFAATDAGRAHLDERREDVEALVARLAALGADEERADAAPVRRAMMNLGAAVRGRVRRGNFTEETMHDVAALLDEVAQKIERLR